VTEPDFLRSTRASYNTVAIHYAERFRGEMAAKPLDRALLAGFADLVRAAGGGPVADVGCGTGRITAYLHELGLAISGVDLSPGMLAVARRTHPGLRFDEGSMLALDLPDAELAGLVAWYSTIHIPSDQLPAVFAEFHRVLAPGGQLLIAFQTGDQSLHLREALGHEIGLDFHRRRPELVAELLGRAGLPVHARMLREPDDVGEFVERTPRAYLLARKPAELSAA